MFDDHDPVLTRLRHICLALPEAEEFVSHGRPNFRAGKVFAVYGSGHDDPNHLILRIDPQELPALRGDHRFSMPPYYPDRLAIDLGDPSTDWREISELVESSYRQVALKRMLLALDGDVHSTAD